MGKIDTIIFDLGNVLINWDPQHVFDKTYFDTPEKKEYFFSHICTMDWNEEQDAGRSLVAATQGLVQQFPEWETAIRDYYGRWTDMLGGPIKGSVEIFRELKETGKYKIYALTNWHSGLFDIALVRYNFLHWFDGRVVSGDEKTRKPFPEIYQRLLDRYQVTAANALFIDDSLRNIKAAAEMGIQTIHFQDPQHLRETLTHLQVL